MLLDIFHKKLTHAKLIGQTILAFLAPIACSYIYDYFSLKKATLSRLAFLRKYSVEEQKPDSTVALPEQEERTIGAWSALGLQRPLVIAMVGLPARGKSYIVKMIMRYLRWIGFECDVFNVGSYRRLHGLGGISADFFSGSNQDANKSREEMAMAVQDMMYTWLKNGEQQGRVAIFDATNTTVARRDALCKRARKENVNLLFVESICDDKEILERNYHMKLQNDDYKHMDPAVALNDFKLRVEEYEKRYHTIEDFEDNGQISYIKLINVGHKVISCHCTGYLPSQVAFYLQNIHIYPRSIYLSLPAENSDSVNSILGGDTPVMTADGRQYSAHMGKFVQVHENVSDFIALTGTARIHAMTVMHLRMQIPVYSTNLLNELRGGDFHHMKREEIKAKYPQVFDARQKDKLHFRYPGVGGESYMDVIERARPIIIELERQRKPCMVVCHLAVMRCIYGYFTGANMEDIPNLAFKQHHLYQLSPGPFGCETREINLADEVKHI